jgi:hypothetical protein
MELKDYYQERLYHEMQTSIQIDLDLAMFRNLKPRLFKDGDSWCCLLGENIQEGIAGFGNSPYNAILEFNIEMERRV